MRDLKDLNVLISGLSVSAALLTKPTNWNIWILQWKIDICLQNLLFVIWNMWYEPTHLPLRSDTPHPVQLHYVKMQPWRAQLAKHLGQFLLKGDTINRAEPFWCCVCSCCAQCPFCEWYDTSLDATEFSWKLIEMLCRVDSHWADRAIGFECRINASSVFVHFSFITVQSSCDWIFHDISGSFRTC